MTSTSKAGQIYYSSTPTSSPSHPINLLSTQEGSNRFNQSTATTLNFNHSSHHHSSSKGLNTAGNTKQSSWSGSGEVRKRNIIVKLPKEGNLTLDDALSTTSKGSSSIAEGAGRLAGVRKPLGGKEKLQKVLQAQNDEWRFNKLAPDSTTRTSHPGELEKGVKPASIEIYLPGPGKASWKMIEEQNRLAAKPYHRVDHSIQIVNPASLVTRPVPSPEQDNTPSATTTTASSPLPDPIPRPRAFSLANLKLPHRLQKAYESRTRSIESESSGSLGMLVDQFKRPPGLIPPHLTSKFSSDSASGLDSSRKLSLVELTRGFGISEDVVSPQPERFSPPNLVERFTREIDDENDGYEGSNSSNEPFDDQAYFSIPPRTGSDDAVGSLSPTFVFPPRSSNNLMNSVQKHQQFDSTTTRSIPTTGSLARLPFTPPATIKTIKRRSRSFDSSIHSGSESPVDSPFSVRIATLVNRSKACVERHDSLADQDVVSISENRNFKGFRSTGTSFFGPRDLPPIQPYSVNSPSPVRINYSPNKLPSPPYKPNLSISSLTSYLSTSFEMICQENSENFEKLTQKLNEQNDFLLDKLTGLAEKIEQLRTDKVEGQKELRLASERVEELEKVKNDLELKNSQLEGLLVIANQSLSEQATEKSILEGLLLEANQQLSQQTIDSENDRRKVNHQGGSDSPQMGTMGMLSPPASPENRRTSKPRQESINSNESNEKEVIASSEPVVAKDDEGWWSIAAATAT